VTDTPKSPSEDADVETAATDGSEKSNAMRRADAANGESNERKTDEEQVPENRAGESPD
jgi:hypothetical protein